jgi:hypothetical protein
VVELEPLVNLQQPQEDHETERILGVTNSTPFSYSRSSLFLLWATILAVNQVLRT